MSEFKGKSVELPASPADVYARMADFSNLGEQLDKVPAEYRAKIGDVKFTTDTIVINAAPAGEITLAITERVPGSRIVLEAQSSPVPLSMIIGIEPGEDEAHARVTPVATVDIPPMLKPFVGPKMQEAADRFGDMLKTIFHADSQA